MYLLLSLFKLNEEKMIKNMIKKALILCPLLFSFSGTAKEYVQTDGFVYTANLYAAKKHTSEENQAIRNLLSIIQKTRAHRFMELGLEYPLNFGVHLRYIASDTIYTRMGLGFMPNFFLNSFERLAPSFGYLNEETAQVISNTFQNSMYINMGLGWSPYLKETGGGPYIELGVSHNLLGKGEFKGSLLSKTIENESFDETKNYSAKTNTYNATVHVGYQIPFEKIKLNIELGLIKILYAEVLSKTSLSADTLLNEQQEESFKNFLKEKGWIFPTVSGWISFSF